MAIDRVPIAKIVAILATGYILIYTVSLWKNAIVIAWKVGFSDDYLTYISVNGLVAYIGFVVGIIVWLQWQWRTRKILLYKYLLVLNSLVLVVYWAGWSVGAFGVL